MSDELKNFLSRELDELKRNKIRVGALIVCFVLLMIFWFSEDDSGEEIILNEQPPATKDLPVKPLPVTKNPDGVTLVLGADSDLLSLADPFADEEKPPPPPKKIVPPPTPQIILQPPPTKFEPEPKPEPKEKILLTGTAISGEVKTAMFLRGEQTLFRSVGDEIDGKKILDISPDFVTLEDGERVYLQEELNP